MRNVKIRGIEFPSANEAIQHANASGCGEVISICGKILVVAESEADRLARIGMEFAYLTDVEMPDGSVKTVSIPVND
jgi:hypothetical protein